MTGSKWQWTGFGVLNRYCNTSVPYPSGPKADTKGDGISSFQHHRCLNTGPRDRILAVRAPDGAQETQFSAQTWNFSSYESFKLFNCSIQTPASPVLVQRNDCTEMQLEPCLAHLAVSCIAGGDAGLKTTETCAAFSGRYK